MTLSEHRLVDAALRLQDHRDRIAALRSQWKRCERIAYYDDDPDDETTRAKTQTLPCWKEFIDPNTGEQCKGDDLAEYYCPSCRANEPIVRERQALTRKTGGLVVAVIRLARRVRAEREAHPKEGT